MNTYFKYAPNVFLAKCEEKQEKGSAITVTTSYGNEHECIVHNFIAMHKDGNFLYSIIRADGYNSQVRAERRAERYETWAASAESKSQRFWESSNEGREFLALGEPIKIGHHSEHRHRALIERNHNRMHNAVELSKKAESHESKAEYWAKKSEEINLSMPESIEYFTEKLERARERHAGLKNGTIKREHSYSLTYANKEVKELEEKVRIAHKLWA